MKFHKQKAQSESEENIPDNIKEMMGPTPSSAPALPDHLQHAAVSDTDGQAAPLIPNDALPKEVQDDVTEPESTVVAESPEKDSDLDEAVDAIQRSESDALIKNEDEAVAKAFQPEQRPTTLLGKCKSFLRRWWRNPKARWGTIAALLFLLSVSIAVPTSRYFILNTLGVRAELQLTVLDDGTKQPLKNVQVKLDDKSALTDSEGKVKLASLKLGTHQLVVEKVAFATQSKKVTIGWGSNPLGDIALQPTGAQYRFIVTDFLSNKPIEKVEANSGIASAVADEKGMIVLTVEVEEQESLEVAFSLKDYRTETKTIPVSMKDTQTVTMVPARQHTFVSKRTGKYDIYKVDADGKNESLLLAGTGNEREDIAIVPHGTKPKLAVISTRQGDRNSDGFLLSNLYVMDVDDGELTDIAQSERIQVIDWVQERLVYVTIAAGQSASSPKRHRLMSYDLAEGTTQELAASNYFNDVMIAKNSIYYAPSSNYQDKPVSFHRVNTDGTNVQTVLNKEVWNIFRTSYETLTLSSGQQWYEYVLGDAAATNIGGAPAEPVNRLYRNNPDASKSVWVDQRDGKGVLLLYDTTTKQEKILRSQSGLRNPVTWLSNKHLVYRINTDQETADYILHIDGGAPKKIRDVTNTGGIDRWYYYQ